MSRTVTVEMTEKQYAAAATLAMVGNMNVEEYLAAIPGAAAETQAATTEWLQIYEEAYRVFTTVAHTMGWAILCNKPCEGEEEIMRAFIHNAMKRKPDAEQSRIVHKVTDQLAVMALEYHNIEITDYKREVILQLQSNGLLGGDTPSERS